MDEEKKMDELEEKKLFDSLWWGGVFIIIGFIFGLRSIDALPFISEGQEWSWIFLLLGLLGILLSVFRYSSSQFSNPKTFDVIIAIIFALVGLSGLTAFDIGQFWWLILIIIGVLVLASNLSKQS